MADDMYRIAQIKMQYLLMRLRRIIKCSGNKSLTKAVKVPILARIIDFNSSMVRLFQKGSGNRNMQVPFCILVCTEKHLPDPTPASAIKSITFFK